MFFAPANSCFGCADVQGHVSREITNQYFNAISSSSNAKNGISRWWWLKVFCTLFEEWIYAISNARNEARMSFSHLLRQSREFHRMNRMCFKIDKMCMSNSELLSPRDNAWDLVFELFAAFKSASKGSFLHFPVRIHNTIQYTDVTDCKCRVRFRIIRVL